MKLYIAEQGCYDNRHVAGIFDSPERAMAYFGGRWRRTVRTHYPDWPSLMRVEHYQDWGNDSDWDDAVTISESELADSGPLHPPDSVQVQTIRQDGRWDSLEISESDADALLAVPEEKP